MTIRLGINGLGRMGRLVFRLAAESDDVTVIRANDPAGNSEIFAHLLRYDSIHGCWNKDIGFTERALTLDGQDIALTDNTSLADTDWHDCDLVVEASGKFRSRETLAPYLEQVSRVVVTAPVPDKDVPDIVMGVNHSVFDPDRHRLVTAASCTTNCLAPVVKVLHESLGIRHGCITTIHDITNTQRILDAPHKDLRRARASGMSLIPTSTGSARAIASIFPDLTGRLNGHAVRVPLANASLTDCVFEMESGTTEHGVNELFREAADGELRGILGYEEKPLVSIDYRTDPRSSIVDAQSTMVVNDTQVKIYAWYDNEWGYVNRVMDLVRLASS